MFPFLSNDTLTNFIMTLLILTVTLNNLPFVSLLHSTISQFTFSLNQIPTPFDLEVLKDQKHFPPKSFEYISAILLLYTCVSCMKHISTLVLF